MRGSGVNRYFADKFFLYIFCQRFRIIQDWIVIHGIGGVPDFVLQLGKRLLHLLWRPHPCIVIPITGMLSFFHTEIPPVSFDMLRKKVILCERKTEFYLKILYQI